MMTKKLRVLISHSHDPYFNLACEDWIFRDLNPDTRILFIWRNQPTVVIGRFQNPWAECNLAKMNEDNILLVRRQSGGGAVFQDLGNTNFTFMSGKNLYKKEDNNQILISALKKMGINALASGRNDLVIEKEDGPRKISGSAFKENVDRSFHHGTMLINVDLNKLASYLSPSKKKLQAKGIQSVRSRVANLTELNQNISHDLLENNLIDEFFKFYQSEGPIDKLDFMGNEKMELEYQPLHRYYHHLKSYEWRLGETPEFSHSMEERFSFGEFNLLFLVQKGIILKCTIYSDTLHPEMVEIMSKKLEGRSYSGQGLTQAFHFIKKDLPMYLSELLEIEDWVLLQIEGQGLE